MRRPFCFLLIAILVLGIFYPSIFAESLSTDDHEMIRGYINMRGLDWQGLFWPATSAYYYRPLLALSFYWDHLLFDNHVAIVHLENILLHLANTLLLYVILGKVAPAGKGDLPWLAAIFFGIHPLVTEPVNWISGRTDLLAGFFVLASFLSFLRNRAKKPGWDLLAAFLYLCGLWSKEVAIGLLPVIFFVCLQEQHFAIKRNWREIGRRLIPFILATFLYGLMRTSGRLSHDLGVTTAMHGGHGAEYFSLPAKFLSLIKAIGFYSQKIIWPFPLNFCIVEINRPLALAVGIIALSCLAFALFFYRRRPFMLGPVWIACFLAPALPVAVNRMAWTPLAERYLYLPLIGLCLFILMAGSSRKKIVALGLAFLLCGFGTATARRNMVWQKNITLWKDVVEKSPSFAAGHNDYAVALLQEGKKEEAGKHFAIAEQLADGKGKNLVQSNIAMIKDDTGQQIAMLETILQSEKSPKQIRLVLNKIIRLINDQLNVKKITTEQQRIWLRKLLVYQEQLAALDNNPYHRYRIGQLHLALGEKAAAQAAFAGVCQASNDYFTQPACTLAKNLAKEIKGE